MGEWYSVELARRRASSKQASLGVEVDSTSKAAPGNDQEHTARMKASFGGA